MLSHPHRDQAWPHFSIMKTSHVLVSRSNPAAGHTACKDTTTYPNLGTERALPSHASRDLPFQQALGTLDVRVWFAVTDVKTHAPPHPETNTFRVSDNLKPYIQGGGLRYAEQMSSKIRILPLQILVMQASYRGLSTVMACRGKMDFKMIIGMTHVAFSPFLLTHNLAVSAEFSSHLKFLFNSQEAHGNSDDLFCGVVRKGASFLKVGGFFESQWLWLIEKTLLWLSKEYGVHVLYHAIKCHLTQGWAESTVFKNETLQEASPLKRCPQSFLSPFAGDLSGHLPVTPNPRQKTCGRQGRHQWGHCGDSTATALGHGDMGLQHQEVPPAKGRHRLSE